MQQPYAGELEVQSTVDRSRSGPATPEQTVDGMRGILDQSVAAATTARGQFEQLVRMQNLAKQEARQEVGGDFMDIIAAEVSMLVIDLSSDQYQLSPETRAQLQEWLVDSLVNNNWEHDSDFSRILGDEIFSTKLRVLRPLVQSAFALYEKYAQNDKIDAGHTQLIRDGFASAIHATFRFAEPSSDKTE